MAAWGDFESEAPELATAAGEIFALHKHNVLATLRRDGSPRVCGTEVVFLDGQIWMGSMPGSRKSRDLQADPRCALHGPTADPDDAWLGDVKIRARAIEESDPAIKQAMLEAGGHADNDAIDEFDLFRLEVVEVVLTRLGEPADHLSIQLWTPGRPVRSFRRT